MLPVPDWKKRKDSVEVAIKTEIRQFFRIVSQMDSTTEDQEKPIAPVCFTRTYTCSYSGN